MFVYPVTRPLSRSALVPRFTRVVDDSIERFLDSVVAPHSVRSPALDVSETDTHYLVAFDLPGVTREQLKVSIEGRRVAVESHALPAPAAEEGEPAKVDAAPAARPLYRERSVARYARTLSLPAEVDQTTSEARFENGVLTLTLAKKVVAGATQLAIA